jgi:hypothetical protein
VVYYLSKYERLIYMQFYKVNRNGLTILHSLSINEVKSFFDKLMGKSSYSYLQASTNHGIYTGVEDTVVDYYHDGVDDEYGWSWHTIIKDTQGNILLDEYGGDWTKTRPNANTVPPRRVPAASVGL